MYDNLVLSVAIIIFALHLCICAIYLAHINDYSYYLSIYKNKFVDCATKEKVISTILTPTICFWLTGVPGGGQW